MCFTSILRASSVGKARRHNVTEKKTEEWLIVLSKIRAEAELA